jgi:long-chain acyl-CoA synthetase
LTHAQQRPHDPALMDDQDTLSWRELNECMDRVAVALTRDASAAGVQAKGQVLVLVGRASVVQAQVFLGALRAGVVVAPMPASVTPTQWAAMVGDAAPQWIVFDDDAQALVAHTADPTVRRINVDDQQALETWLAPVGAIANAAHIEPGDAFNIIYSSGTTGTPKGIVQSHGMRAMHIARGARYDYGPGRVTLLATPLYSNTTLVVLAPSVAAGSLTVLMRKFDAARYLTLAAQHRVTHTMLVPVQIQRILSHPSFDLHDLSAFRHKFCTSAPFSAALKRETLARWPGGMTEFYGMTEGGGTCILDAHQHPDKLHTVGRPSEGHDMRLIDGQGVEVAPGEMGEVVGHSPSMMTGYHRRPDATRDAEWWDSEGKRFIRTGDIGRFDNDGFLVLMDRKKDMIISGGFNLYPSDLEHELLQHERVLEAAVVGVPSETWGETPVAYVVLRASVRPAATAHTAADAQALKDWLNARVGKTQRVAAVVVLEELPRSAIGTKARAARCLSSLSGDRGVVLDKGHVGQACQRGRCAEVRHGKGHQRGQRVAPTQHGHVHARNDPGQHRVEHKVGDGRRQHPTRLVKVRQCRHHRQQQHVECCSHHAEPEDRRHVITHASPGGEGWGGDDHHHGHDELNQHESLKALGRKAQQCAMIASNAA